MFSVAFGSERGLPFVAEEAAPKIPPASARALEAVEDVIGDLPPIRGLPGRDMDIDQSFDVLAAHRPNHETAHNEIHREPPSAS